SVGIAAVLQQEPQDRISVAKNRSLIDRSPPFDLLDRDRRSARDEQANLAFVVKRPEKRCRPAPVLRVDVRSLIDQERQAVERAESGGVMERRRAGRIL